MKIESKITKAKDNWVEFEVIVNGAWYRGSAKIFEVGSPFGIGGGPISKLQIKNKYGLVFNYDRSLDFSKLSHGRLFLILQILIQGGVK